MNSSATPAVPMSPSSFASSSLSPCVRSMAEVLSRPDLLKRAFFSEHLHNLARLFRERLLIVHQAHLREMPRLAYSAIAAALGAATPLPAGARLHRYNSV